jgi:hypothetical protein
MRWEPGTGCGRSAPDVIAAMTDKAHSATP